jgi:PhnB protein
MKTNPYLHFDGNCEEALNFYQKLLGAKPLMMMRYGDMPTGHGPECPAAVKDKIAHGRIAIGEDIIMGSDAPPGRYSKPTGLSINIGVATPEEAEKIFAALAETGAVLMPIEETFWAHRFGMVTDRFGTPWMVNCEKQG